MDRCELSSRRLARVMRHNPTECEVIVWRWLRCRRFLGVKFRRQHPIGSYILDFYCRSLKLAIEIDGSGHGTATQMRVDERRTSFLRSLGITVLRVTNEEVRDTPTFVADRIAATIQSLMIGRRRHFENPRNAVDR